jgi:small multidrug resistance pump
LALEGIDISIVYAIWSGIGTIFVAIIGYFVFEEKISVKKSLSLLLIVLGVFGIHLTNALH